MAWLPRLTRGVLPLATAPPGRLLRAPVAAALLALAAAAAAPWLCVACAAFASASGKTSMHSPQVVPAVPWTTRRCFLMLSPNAYVLEQSGHAKGWRSWR